MPTDEERIKALDARVAANQTRLANLKTAQRLNDAIKADEAKRADLQAKLAKKQAEGRRRADARAKIILGAGVSILPMKRQVETIRAVLKVLSERDCGIILKWCAGRGVNLDDQEQGQVEQIPPDSSALPHPVVRAIENFDQGSFEWLTAEILSRTSGQEQQDVETWIASRTSPEGR